MQSLRESLTKISVLNNLDSGALEQLQSHTVIKHYLKDEIVICEGDCLPPQLYALIEGTLQVWKTAVNGKETLVRIIASGEIFAAPAIFGNGIAPATVRCQTDSIVLTIEREALLETIRHQPEVALRILEVFNQRLQHLHNTVHGLISERAIVRIVRLIQYYANRYGTQPVEGGDCLNLHLSYAQIARSIGITYEECLRLMKTIKSAIVYQRGGKIIIKDWQKLEEIAS
ncbi:MAG: Crp/Fnr family transcriptional regulator [Lyngbya sp.]|nr:Crp/Fnr family transcriptional regulator [Lyngbya sp.]